MKNARHEEILKIIEDFDIETQEELAAKLQERGFFVTQATISRDIRQLQLTKHSGPDGRAVYMSETDDSNTGSRYRQILRNSFVSAESASNMIVIHTVSGMAMGASAALDAYDWPEMLGTIAGDDTIFAVVRTESEAVILAEKIRSLAG